MASRKRSQPETESASSLDPPPPPSAVERELASREIFFSIPLRSTAVHDQPLHSLAPPGGDHALANRRLMDTATVLNSLQRASVTAVLAVLNNYFPEDETTYSLTHSIADLIETDDLALASVADKIDLGLIAFLAKRAGCQYNRSDVGPPSPAPINHKLDYFCDYYSSSAR
ncbi:hypothetical protein Q9L58_010382 [Maublancomyces gigas]|uniref:Uncharacterized protein n=1 Tax=Discina gigas TaxID=1032678 RepID=A0ABR3G490_9PEZI